MTLTSAKPSHRSVQAAQLARECCISNMRLLSASLVSEMYPRDRARSDNMAHVHNHTVPVQGEA